MYQAIYKCRLCGEEFHKSKMNIYDAELAATTLIVCETAYHQSNPELTIHRKETHNCKDGSFGFADFKGLRKVED